MNNEKTAGKTIDRFYRLQLCRGCASSKRPLGMSGCLARAASFLLLLVSLNAFATNEETFATLKVGDHTYQNVRVTTKGKNFIIITHSGGISSIKVSELPGEILRKLGYAPAPRRKKQMKEAAIWAGLAVPKTDTLVIKPPAAKISQAWHRTGLASKVHLSRPTARLVLVAAAILTYLFYSYCCLLICQKTGNEPGVWVWVRLVQAFPMLRAASMSAWWSVALFIPGLNLLGYVLWCVRIVQARRKTVSLTVLMLFPLTTWLAFV